MANAKISQLPAVVAVNGADLAVVVQGGTTSQTSVDDLFTDRTMVAPVLGTPASGNLSNCTSLPVSTGISGLGAGVATFLATPSSANLASAVTGETGSGALVFATSPTLVTPTLGVATATSINKMAVTAPATSSTLAVADGKTFTASNTLTVAGTDGKTVTFNNSITFAGTDSTTMTFPGTNATIARTDAANTFTGNQTVSNALITTPDARNGAGAVSITTVATAYTSAGAAEALTLADGAAGQIKTIVYVAESDPGDSGVLTPTNFGNGTTVTFNAVGDSVTLQFLGTDWWVIAINGAVIG